MSERREHPFTSTTLFIAGSLLIWLANFVVVYVLAALACARGFATVRLLGLPIVPVLTTVSSIAAAIVTLLLLRKGAAALHDSAQTEHSRFIGFVALATSVLAMIGLVLLALPPLVVSACARQ
jgi:uncharacterized membrane protein